MKRRKSQGKRKLLMSLLKSMNVKYRRLSNCLKKKRRKLRVPLFKTKKILISMRQARDSQQLKLRLSPRLNLNKSRELMYLEKIMKNIKEALRKIIKSILK